MFGSEADSVEWVVAVNTSKPIVQIVQGIVESMCAWCPLIKRLGWPTVLADSWEEPKDIRSSVQYAVKGFLLLAHINGCEDLEVAEVSKFFCDNIPGMIVWLARCQCSNGVVEFKLVSYLFALVLHSHVLFDIATHDAWAWIWQKNACNHC